MSIRHTFMKGVALSTLLLLVAGPAGAATSDTSARGTATTTSIPLHIEALGQTADVGRTVLMATTDSDKTTLAPWSTVQLTLATLGEQDFGQVSVSSDGTTMSESAEVNESNELGQVSATAANVLALADGTAGTARAELETLTADAAVLLNAVAPEDLLQIEATVSDAITTVDDGGAEAKHSLVFAGIDLDLAHVLGGVLDKLPLQDLLALADQLGVEAPVNLDPASEVVAATTTLVGAIAAAVDAAEALDIAAQALFDADADADDPLVSYGDIAAIQTVEGTVDGLTSGDTGLSTTLGDAIADLNDAGLDCSVELTDLGAALTFVQDCIDQHLLAYAAALDALSDEFDALESAVTNYVAAVEAAALTATDIGGNSYAVSEVLADIEALVGGLLGADLLRLGPIDVRQRVYAVGGQLDDSSASHTCEVTAIAALGADPVEIANCDGSSNTLTTVVDTITGTLQTVIDTVEGVDTGDGVSLELFGTVEDTVTELDDGWVRATSVMEVLALTVPDITVAPCEVADGLVCGLGIDLEGTLGTLQGISNDVLTTAQTTAVTAITSVSELLDPIALDGLGLIDDVTSVDATAAQDDVNTAVTLLTDALQDLIDGLSLGTAGGAKVPGVEIVVDPTLAAEHQVTTASVDDPTGADPAPDPDDDPTLPNTGGGAALLAILAMGAGAWLWRRREVE